MLHTMITASNPHFRGKISSLLEELLAAAVTEICELFDNEFANVTLRAECPKCMHSKEVDRSNLTPRRSSPSRNFHRFSSRDEDPQRDCSRGEFERDINADVGMSPTPNTTQHLHPVQTMSLHLLPVSAETVLMHHIKLTLDPLPYCLYNMNKK